MAILFVDPLSLFFSQVIPAAPTWEMLLAPSPETAPPHALAQWQTVL